MKGDGHGILNVAPIGLWRKKVAIQMIAITWGPPGTADQVEDWSMAAVAPALIRIYGAPVPTGMT